MIGRVISIGLCFLLMANVALMAAALCFANREAAAYGMWGALAAFGCLLVCEWIRPR